MHYSGRNLEEALQNAEKATGMNRNEFEYEITKSRKFPFLKEVDIEIEKIFKESLAAVKNCKIFIKGGDIPAQISFDENIDVVVNGIKANSGTKLTEEDNVQINVNNSESHRDMKIVIDKDLMKATLSIEYNSQKIYEIEDSDFQNILHIKSKLIKENNPVKYIKDDVLLKIKESHIKYGINIDDLNSVLDNGGNCVIAEGKRPAYPVDDSIILYFNKENEKTPEEINGKVDYYYKKEILYVEKGDILAKLVPGQNGSYGIDIYGRTIKVPQKATKKLKSGPGTDFVKNDNTIIAKIKGVPRQDGDKICVFPALTYNSDVDLKTGNISFNGGDIIVKGNVMQGIKINAGENVSVSGYVTESEITAAGNIKVYENVISSSLTAGNRQIEKRNAIKYLKKHYDYISEMMKAYEQLRENEKISSKINDGRIFKVLLETQFSKYKQFFYEESKEIDLDNIDDKLKEICRSVNKFFICIDEELMDDYRMMDMMKDKLKIIINDEEADKTLASIYAGYCQNSKLQATEDINILGKGCYNTNIIAGSDVTLSGSPGIFRGGQIVAVGKVHIKEAGSKAGVLTVIKTSKEGEIEINTAYQNVIFYFGKLVYRVEEPCKMLKAYVKNSEIYIEKLKY